MKKSLLFLTKLLVIVTAVVIFYLAFSHTLDVKIARLYKENALAINHANGLDVKDKGNVLFKYSLESPDNMLVLGSSELSSPVPENLKNLFPNDLYAGDIICAGHAHVQNALHAISLGANDSYVCDNDVVIVESLQWFTGKDIDFTGFFANFSELQFYEFLQNDNISVENKLYLCNRYIQLENYHIKDLAPHILDLTTNNATVKKGLDILASLHLTYGDIAYPQTYTLARLYVSDGVLGNVAEFASKPYFYLRYKFLQLKDKYKTYEYLAALNSPQQDNDIVTINWDEIYSTAESEGKTACTNNELYVYDDYYTKYLEESIDEIKDRDKDVRLLESNEWNDYKFFLSVCNDLDIKPYVIIMSTNGLYYDHIGISKESRDDYYNQIEKTSNEYGVDCLNLKDKEYEPYFYCDAMHLGWKGWPYVIQNIIQHYEE